MSEDKEQYSSLIRQLVPIADLSPHLQDEAMGIATVTKIKKKQFVFKQGDKDSYSYYILNGEIELHADKTLHSTIVGGTDRARYALAQLQPRQFSAKSKTEVIILQLERVALDRLMVMVEKDDSDDTITGDSQMEVSDLDSEESGDWMTSMLQSELFSQLPMANIHQLFALLEPMEFNAGDSVIKQGEPGEHYYIIQEGRCEVTRAPSSGSDPIKLAELKVGDSFGEEALLTDAKRNASINMLTNGVMMQLSKTNFINLIKKPALVSLSYEEAKKQVAEGATWLDVRFKNEHEDMNIEGSINLPLNVLRMQTDKLQADKQYIVYCDTGGRSSAATFLLAQRGFNVSYLDKGLVSVPELASKQEPQKEEKPKEEKPEAKKVEEEKEVDKSELEPSIRASVLKADLAKKEVELEETKEQSVASDDKVKQKEQKAAQEKLEKERKKLEAEKAAAEKEAKKKSEQEAANIEKLKADAEKRLQAEKKKLEEVYERNTKEMEKLQRMKKEAGEQIKKEREKLQKEAAAAQEKLEKAAAEKKAQQESMEKQLQEKAKAKIEQERRKLAEEMAKSSDVLEQAKREKVAADAARKAAEEEAQKIIAEYKQQFDKERAEEDARIKEERKKLEEESNKIQDTLKEIQNAKQGAEAARKTAEEQAVKLKEQQKQEENTQDSATKKALDSEIKEAEAKLAEARKNIESAEEAEHTIVEVKEVNEEELRRQKELEEEMRKHTAADLAEFMEEHEEQEKSKPKVVDSADHAKRIKESADAAKEEVEKATDDLFADIASQLGND